MPPPRGRSPRLLTAGYLTLDLIVRDLETRDHWHVVGGTCGNVSVFTSVLGAEVTILGRVGEDQRGRRLLQHLAAAGVDATHVERLARPRTPAVVEFLRGSKNGAHRFAFRCPVCNVNLPRGAVVSKRTAIMEAENIERFDAFFFDRATPATVRVAEAARHADLFVMFEPTSVPQTEWAERAAALSDVVKVSQQPGEGLSSWTPTRGASTRFIIETLGSRGARVRSRSRRGWSAWQQVPAVANCAIPCTRYRWRWRLADGRTDYYALTRGEVRRI